MVIKGLFVCTFGVLGKVIFTGIGSKKIGLYERGLSTISPPELPGPIGPLVKNTQVFIESIGGAVFKLSSAFFTGVVKGFFDSNQEFLKVLAEKMDSLSKGDKN